MNWFVAAQFPLQENLSVLDKALHQHNVTHRFTEERGVQLLWLVEGQDPKVVLDIVESLKNGSVGFVSSGQEHANAENVKAAETNTNNMTAESLFRLIRQLPVTAVLLLGGVLGFLIVFFGIDTLFFAFNFNPDAIRAGEYWRIITPIFIHFGIVHIVFNALWIWEVGKRLEVRIGTINLILLVLVSAVLSNVGQFIASQSLFFGGLSGVVYAYFGCNFIIHTFRPTPLTVLPKAIYVLVIVWLIIGFLGVIDFFLAGAVANWAHLLGLIAGVLYAFVYLLVTKVSATHNR